MLSIARETCTLKCRSGVVSTFHPVTFGDLSGVVCTLGGVTGVVCRITGLASCTLFCDLFLSRKIAGS